MSVRLRIPLIVLSALACGSGCLLESHESAGQPWASFCERFFDAACAPIETCGCSRAAVEACRAEQRVLCAAFPSPALESAFTEGRVLYDAEAAEALLTRLDARGDDCAGFVDTLGWSVDDLLSLGGVFEGTLTGGEACDPLGFELVSVCFRGVCAPEGRAYRCRSVVGEGEACGPSTQCADLAGALTPERGVERLTLRCTDGGATGEAGVCAGWLQAGEVCEVGAACWTSRCEAGRCVALADGETCFSGRDCASGYCSLADRRCAPGGAADGEPCDAAGRCASHVCIEGRCEPVSCGLF